MSLPTQQEVIDLLAKANNYKETGNTYYKSGDYSTALSNYTKIFLYINHLDVNNEISGLCVTLGENVSNSGPSLSNELLQQVKSLKILGNLNCCQSALKLKQYEKALQFAERVKQLHIQNISFTTHLKCFIIIWCCFCIVVA